MDNHPSSGPIDGVWREGYFRTLEKLRVLEEIPDFCTPCDKIKPTFSAFLRNWRAQCLSPYLWLGWGYIPC
jgi:hypothetical protein